jgi:hypothetical protein
MLSQINCPCVVRFWAKHSQIKAICKFINFCGNAMPLQFLDQPQTWELLEAIANNDPDEKLKEFAKKELAKLSENPVGA